MFILIAQAACGPKKIRFIAQTICGPQNLQVSYAHSPISQVQDLFASMKRTKSKSPSRSRSPRMTAASPNAIAEAAEEAEDWCGAWFMFPVWVIGMYEV